MDAFAVQLVADPDGKMHSAFTGWPAEKWKALFHITF
jgi:hypothetical protein